MNSFYFDKMLMFYNQNKSYVKSCKKCFLKTHCFPKKTIVFQHVHFSNPLFWNEKLSLITTHSRSISLTIPHEPDAVKKSSPLVTVQQTMATVKETPYILGNR